MLLSKPYLTLHVHTHEFFGYVEVNGQIVVHADGMPKDSELPVGQWLHEESNELLLLIAPGEDGEFPTDQKIQLTLREREAGNHPDDWKPIATLKWNGALANSGEGIEGNTEPHRLNSAGGYAIDEDGDVWVEEVAREAFGPGAIVRRKIFLPKMSLPRWKWIDSDDLTEEDPGPDLEGRVDPAVLDDIKAELFPFYKQVWDALLAEDVAKVMGLFAERSEEMEGAFFKQPGEYQNRLQQMFEDTVADEGAKLFGLDDGNCTVELHDNNKIARLKQNDDQPLISFDFKDAGSRAFDIMFRKQGDDWIVTR